MLRDVIDPKNPQPTSGAALVECFKALVINAYQRKALLEPFVEVLEKTVDMAQTVEQFSEAVQKVHTLKTAGVMPPQEMMDDMTTIGKRIIQLREWAIEHIDLISQCPGPQDKIN
jgi:hypothetical protein